MKRAAALYSKIIDMRLLFSILLATAFVCAGCAKVQTPDIVKAALDKKYPGAIEVSWSKDRNKMHEAHFRLDGEKYRADFLTDGTWIETEQNVGWGDLPDDVKGAFKGKSNCDKLDIIEIEKVDHYEKGVFYDIEYKKKGKKKDMGIREDGEIVKGI